MCSYKTQIGPQLLSRPTSTSSRTRSSSAALILSRRQTIPKRNILFMDVPLHKLKGWSPFHLDALGLVTLLGAEEVSNAIGALEHSQFTEYLPVFGTYLIAANKFTRPIPGFALYNISDGVYIPILNGWFSRWLIANLTEQVTILDWKVEEKERSAVANEIVAAVIGFITNGTLISMAALQGDFYGLANAIAMALSVIVRLKMVHENRKHLNHIVADYADDKLGNRFLQRIDENLVRVVITVPEDKVVAFEIPRGLIGCIRNDLDVDDHYKKEPQKDEAPNIHPEQSQSSNLSHSGPDMGQLDPNSPPSPPPVAPQATASPQSLELSPKSINLRAVEEGVSHPLEKSVQDRSIPISKTGYLRELLVQTYAKFKPFHRRHTWSYTFARGVCWVFFAIHVICIGQSTLLTQILSIALLASSTVLTIYGVGNNYSTIGSRLTIKKMPPGARPFRHKDAYYHLHPSKEEERIMRSYLLLPYKPDNDDEMDNKWNRDWWKRWKEENPSMD